MHIFKDQYDEEPAGFVVGIGLGAFSWPSPGWKHQFLRVVKMLSCSNKESVAPSSLGLLIQYM